jgi:hypothetical protein
MLPHVLMFLPLERSWRYQSAMKGMEMGKVTRLTSAVLKENHFILFMCVIVSPLFFKWRMKTINMDGSWKSYAFLKFMFPTIRILWTVFCVILDSSVHWILRANFVSTVQYSRNNYCCFMASSCLSRFILEFPHHSIAFLFPCETCIMKIRRLVFILWKLTN